MEPRAGDSTASSAAGPCHDDGPAADVCQPRVRCRLLVVGCGDGSRGLLTLAAERLRPGPVRRPEVDDALEYIASARVSCAVLDASSPGFEPLAVLGRLK